MKINKQYLWNILLIISITCIAMYFSLKDNFQEIMDAIARMNPGMLVLVLCWGLLFTAVWGISYQILARRYVKKYSLKQGIIVSFVGTFFSGITPSSTGGQFGQLYVLKKQGVDYSDAASLLWADFIIYQTTMMIYVTILFALRFQHYANLSTWFWIVFAGYLVNLAVVVGLYTIALFPKFYIRIATWGVGLLGRMHILKHPEQTLANAEAQMTNFTREIKKLSQDWKVIIQCMIVNFLRLTLYFSLPFIIANGLSIHLPISKLIDCLTLSSFVTMANSFIPLPGAAGGTEFVFSLLYSRMLGSLTGAVMLLWRMSTYYIPVIAGALIFLIFKNRNDRQKELAKEKEKALQQASQNADSVSADRSAAGADTQKTQNNAAGFSGLKPDGMRQGVKGLSL